MKGWWDRFWDGFGVGFCIVFFAFFLLWLAFQWGHQAGWSDGMNEYARQDGGVYMQVTIGDKLLKGYMR